MSASAKPEHCCGEMTRLLAVGEVSLIYTDRHRSYGILYPPECGLGQQVIHFCPWCGSKLPRPLDDEWFDLLEGLGLEPGDPNIPAEMRSDAWWRNRGL